VIAPVRARTRSGSRGTVDLSPKVDERLAGPPVEHGGPVEHDDNDDVLAVAACLLDAVRLKDVSGRTFSYDR